mgnify:CR=1 FL=1
MSSARSRTPEEAAAAALEALPRVPESTGDMPGAHLPDDLVDAEQIEAIISTFTDMGIQVYDQAPAP